VAACPTKSSPTASTFSLLIFSTFSHQRGRATLISQISYNQYRIRTFTPREHHIDFNFMRLLRSNDFGGFSLAQFREENVPSYAILSHTWGPDDDEVSFEDLRSCID
jgi:hypothetical protein